MEDRANSEVFFLPDEKFDFDVSLSPASATGDEDENEVFVGPISHKERCVSLSVASQVSDGGGGDGGAAQVSWSPLTGEQLEAVCQEAHKLANQLQSGSEDTAANATTETDEFVQDAEAKLSMLGQTASLLSPIKRETFCMQDSPMKQLPPAIQRQLLRGSSTNPASSPRRSAAAASSTRRTSAASSTRLAATSTAKLSTSSPLTGAKAPLRSSLRGKASLGVTAVLPSKLAVPATSSSVSKSRAEKTRLQAPSKTAVGWKRSPSFRRSSRAGSCEDLLSDSASVASDVSDSSFNSSLVGKRAVAPATKSVGGRNLSGGKAPPLQSRRAMDRKNTSSSSSSVSSFNSSMSLSPAKGKLNSSLNQSLNGSTGHAPSSVSRPTNPSRPRRSTAEPAPSVASRRSLSTRARKLSEAERAKGARPTPLKRPEATPLQPTPTKRHLEKIASIPTSGRPQSGPKAKTKPEALVLPTPSIGGKGVQHGDDVSKVSRPKRLMSLGSMESLPQKPSAGPLTPSGSSCKPLQLKTRRPSALPTPVKRRASAIPSPVSANPARTVRPPAFSDPDPTPSSARKQHRCSPALKYAQVEEPIDAPDIQPFYLEEEEEVEVEETPAAPPSNTQQPDQPQNVDPGAPSPSESEPSTDLMELETSEESSSKTQEVLLLDLPPPALQPQEKLLIDLTNTPTLIRTSAKTSAMTQLIDLSSPLIKWSPEEKRENNAPLINLSF